jgi:hypothetical protein
MKNELPKNIPQKRIFEIDIFCRESMGKDLEKS